MRTGRYAAFEQCDDFGAPLLGLNAFGEHARRSVVAAAQDAEHDVFAPDPIALVR
jgi:hypothetical protein